jgi:hypothetical protein
MRLHGQVAHQFESVSAKRPYLFIISVGKTREFVAMQFIYDDSELIILHSLEILRVKLVILINDADKQCYADEAI